jgi:hypothetical protein
VKNLSVPKKGGNVNLLTDDIKVKNGANGIRTHDLLHAMQALSQLSYGPVSIGFYQMPERQANKFFRRRANSQFQSLLARELPHRRLPIIMRL